MQNTEFKKKLSFFGQSLRSSFRDNTASVVLLFFSIFVMTIFSAFSTKGLTDMVYEDIYPSFFSAFEIPPSQQTIIKNNFSKFTDIVLETSARYEGISVELTYALPSDEISTDNMGTRHYMYLVSGTNEYFTSEQITNGEKNIVLSEDLAADYGGTVGSTINFFGSDYIITKIFISRNSQKICYIPITAPPSDFLSERANFRFRTIYFTFVPEEFYFGGEQEFIKFGLDMPERKFSLSSSVPLILLLSVCLFSGINILAVYAYFAKVNGHKYSIYKTLGAKNGNLAAMMLAEVMIIAVAAFGIGLFFDFVVSTVFDATKIKLPAIHYSILIGINLITVLLSTVFSVVKRARLMPVDRRIW